MEAVSCVTHGGVTYPALYLFLGLLFLQGELYCPPTPLLFCLLCLQRQLFLFIPGLAEIRPRLKHGYYSCATSIDYGSLVIEDLPLSIYSSCATSIDYGSLVIEDLPLSIYSSPKCGSSCDSCFVLDQNVCQHIIIWCDLGERKVFSFPNILILWGVIPLEQRFYNVLFGVDMT
jgi:hypothetical protein